MKEYIDKAELLRDLKRKIKESNEYRMAVVDSDFIDLVNDATVIEDVVEVVRCKDCVYCDEVATDPITNYSFGFCRHHRWQDVDGWERETDGQDYCSYGERKEQEK